MPYTPSLIQTILSVPESHRFMQLSPLADYTAGGESHPAPKTNMRLFSRYMIHHVPPKCNRFLLNFSIYCFAVIFYCISINND